MTKKALIILLFLAAPLGGAWYFHTHNSPAAATPAGGNIAVIATGTIEDIVTAQGKLEPREYVDVGAQVSGQLKTIHVEIGDVVQKGDLIAEIDPKIYLSRVQADEARLKTLGAQLDEQQAAADLAALKQKRNEQLIKSKAISAEALDDSAAALKSAQARLAALRAQIEEQQSTLDGDRANLGYTKIYAPMDGTVVLQPTREGQTLNSSQSAPIVVQLADLAIMTVRAQVAEADVTRLKPGMSVYFTTLGAPERKWPGTVRQILPSPETVNDVVLYNVLVDVDNKDRHLMTGMSTQLFFLADKAENVPLIPVAALGKRVNGEGGYEVQMADGKTRPIRVGLMDRAMAEVKEGLAPGDKVLLPAPPDADQKKQQRGGFRGGPRL